MNKKIISIVSLATLLVLPVAALAVDAGSPPPTRDVEIGAFINTILNFLWPIFIGFAVIMFLIAGFMFLLARGDASQVAAARQAVLWGIVGVAVGVLAFSIPFIVRTTLGF